MAAIMFANFINRYDVRMTEPGNDFCFLAKPSDKFRAGKWPVQHHFQGHDAVQIYLPRPIDHSHAAARDFFQKLIIAHLQKNISRRDVGF